MVTGVQRCDLPILVREEGRPRERPQETTEHTQQGRFTGPVRPHETEDLPASNIECGAVQCDSRTETFSQLTRSNRVHLSSPGGAIVTRTAVPGRSPASGAIRSLTAYCGPPSARSPSP